MRTRLIILLALLGTLAQHARAQSIVLTEPQRKKLAQIVHADKEAASLYAAIKHDADKVLGDAPKPIGNILTEGKLAKDPAKIKTEESLGDMHKLDVLGYAYAVEGDAKYAAKVREFILAWAKINHSAGDPIDDTNLEPLLAAYDFTRSTFSPADRQTVDTYLRSVAQAEIDSGDKKHDNAHNNWHSHRLKIVGLIALLLQNKSAIDQTVALYKDQIDHNVHPDGSTYDFYERDALHYHMYDIEPLLTLAIAARNNSLDLYSYQSKDGATLAKAVAFLLPYAQGTKTHAEFVNSKVTFDKKRADAGQKEYEAGASFEPHSAINVLSLAQQFQPNLLDTIQKLNRHPTQKYPNWQIVLNDARR